MYLKSKRHQIFDSYYNGDSNKQKKPPALRMAFLILSDLPVLSHFDLNFNAAGQFKFHQRVNCF